MLAIWGGKTFQFSIPPMLDGAEFFAAHNAPFDKGVLAACCAKADGPINNGPINNDKATSQCFMKSPHSVCFILAWKC